MNDVSILRHQSIGRVTCGLGRPPGVRAACGVPPGFWQPGASCGGLWRGVAAGVGPPGQPVAAEAGCGGCGVRSRAP